jgi:outer membrane usher protein
MRRAVIALLAGLLGVLSSAPAAQPTTLLAVEVQLNGQSRGPALVAQSGDEFLIEVSDARAWRFRVPEGAVRSLEGRDFVPLAALGVRPAGYDALSGRLGLEAPPDAFIATVYEATNPSFRLTPAAWGGFLTYDVLATRLADTNSLGAALEASLFSPYASLATQYVARDLWTNGTGSAQMVRTATALRRDFPDQLVSLQIGDAVTRPGAQGQALRFGGAIVATDFNLRPGFITQPLPTFSGDAALPSTVEVFVQNQLRTVTQVPAGPFTLDNVPVITGAGDARIVVRDALGREQVVTSAFYSAGQLLRPGLNEFAVAAGKLRTDRADGSPDYGNEFAAGVWRRGMNDWLTLELRGEYEKQRTQNLGGSVLVGTRLGEFEVSGTVADVEGVGGRLGGAVGWFYRDLLTTLGARYESLQSDFIFAGTIDPARALRNQFRATASRSLGRGWSVGAFYLDAETQDGDHLRSLNASATWALPRGSNLLFSFNRIDGSSGTRNVYGVLLTVPLAPSTFVSAGLEGGSDSRQTLVAQRTPPIDEGYGWRVAASHDSSGVRADAGAIAQLKHVSLSAEVSRVPGQSVAARAGAAGSLVLVEDKAALTRPVFDSFALVRLPGVPNVPVLLNNQLAGTTDEEGRLLLPRLQAYVPNEIRVDVTALPPDVQVDRDRVIVVPPARSGVRAVVAVERVAAAILSVQDAAGRPLAVGSTVRMEPAGQASSVGLRGEVFVSGTAGPRVLEIVTQGRTCRVRFELPVTPPASAYSQLGPYTCEPY